MTYVELVRYCFDKPNMCDEEANLILYGCTGFPCFFPSGNIIKHLVQQLYHAKRSLARGYSVDDIYFGKDIYRS